MSEATQARYFPYTGASGWLTKLHQLCVRSMPSRIEPEWLGSKDRLALSRGNASSFLNMMQKIGWLEQDGTVTESGKQLRLVGDAWQEAMRRTASGLYPDLLEQISTASQFTSQDLEQFFVSATDVGRSGRSQMVSVFRWFLREAGMSDVEGKIWSARGPRPGTAKPRYEGPREHPATTSPKASPSRGRSKARTEDRGNGAQARQEAATSKDERLVAIASVLRITIDGTWEEKRMEAAFKMLDRLLKEEPIN